MSGVLLFPQGAGAGGYVGPTQSCLGTSRLRLDGGGRYQGEDCAEGGESDLSSVFHVSLLAV